MLPIAGSTVQTVVFAIFVVSGIATVSLANFHPGSWAPASSVVVSVVYVMAASSTFAETTSLFVQVLSALAAAPCVPAGR